MPVEGEVPVCSFFLNWFFPAEGANRVDKFIGAERGAAFFALVAIGARVSANGASAFDIAVGQEGLRFFVVILFRFFCFEFTGIVEDLEEFPGCFVVDGCAGSMIDIEADTHIGKVLPDNGVVFIDNSLCGGSFFHGLDRDGGAMFIAAANKYYVTLLRS